MHAQLCLILCDPMDCSPPSSTVHGMFQARILEWVVTSFSRGPSQSRDQTQVSCISCTGRQILYHCATCQATRWDLQNSVTQGTGWEECCTSFTICFETLGEVTSLCWASVFSSVKWGWQEACLAKLWGTHEILNVAGFCEFHRAVHSLGSLSLL